MANFGRLVRAVRDGVQVLEGRLKAPNHPAFNIVLEPTSNASPGAPAFHVHMIDSLDGEVIEIGAAWVKTKKDGSAGRAYSMTIDTPDFPNFTTALVPLDDKAGEFIIRFESLAAAKAKAARYNRQIAEEGNGSEAPATTGGSGLSAAATAAARGKANGSGERVN